MTLHGAFFLPFIFSDLRAQHQGNIEGVIGAVKNTSKLARRLRNCILEIVGVNFLLIAVKSLLFKDPQSEGSVLIIQGPTELRQCPYYSRPTE